MNFLQGSYGFDMLSAFLILLGAIFNIFPVTEFIGLALVIIVLYRTFSKNIYRRQSELNIFTFYANKFLGKFGKRLPDNLPILNLSRLSFAFTQIKLYMEQQKRYKILKCPNCKQKLRLPRKKGAIVVTCRKCSNKFDART